MKPIFTCMVAGIQYLLHPQKLGTIEATINPDALLPVTLLSTEEIYGDLEGILQLFDEYDDVFTPDFGAVLIEKPGGGNGTAASDPHLHGVIQDIYRLHQVTESVENMTDLPSGPYFLHGPNLYQAWRLYEDTLGAFTFGVIPDDVNQPEEFQVVSSLEPRGNGKSIPVPSRLYHPRPSPREPLSGVRMAITDTLSLKGVPTTLSSRAWASLFKGPAHRTDDHVRKLINQGAVVVGKTKTGQLGMGAEWVDEQAPWSPRGDGYQRMSGSSVGAVAGIAGYEWLKHAVGDGRIPPQQGVYSIATSIEDHSRGYDKLRLLGRDLDELSSLTTNSLDLETSAADFPMRILYPTDMTSAAPQDHRRLFQEFITVLESFLHVKTENISLASRWAETSPAEANGARMQEYMKRAPYGWFAKQYYETFDMFRDQYRQRFQQEPFVEATPKDTGKNISWSMNEEYLNRIRVYREWFDKNIMSLESSSNSKAIMVLPCEPTAARYRDQPPAPPTAPRGVTSENLADIILQAPELIVPFAQLPYESRISGRTEHQSVCVSILGAPGSDAMMIKLVTQAFERAKWRTQVDTGRLTFPLGNNLRNVKDGPQANAAASQASPSDEL